MKHIDINEKKNQGFTLVEVMITLLISGIISLAVYSQYRVQQHTYTVQDQVGQMQQNIRAALQMMVTSIRQAGCDPTGRAGAGIVVASPNQFQFTADLAGSGGTPNDGDGDLNDTNEDITFGFGPAFDADGNGIADGGVAGADWSVPANMGMNVGAGFTSISENFDAIEFNYILANGTGTTAPNASEVGLIRSVQISLLGRASFADPKFVNAQAYTTAAGTPWNPPNDGFRRHLTIVHVQCRNLGL